MVRAAVSLDAATFVRRCTSESIGLEDESRCATPAASAPVVTTLASATAEEACLYVISAFKSMTPAHDPVSNDVSRLDMADVGKRRRSASDDIMCSICT